jgi:hypothetical protein
MGLHRHRIGLRLGRRGAASIRRRRASTRRGGASSQSARAAAAPRRQYTRRDDPDPAARAKEATMNIPVAHRLVALALAVVVTLGLFQTISRFAAPEHGQQLLVRVQAETPARS